MRHVRDARLPRLHVRQHASWWVELQPPTLTNRPRSPCRLTVSSSGGIVTYFICAVHVVCGLQVFRISTQFVMPELSSRTDRDRKRSLSQRIDCRTWSRAKRPRTLVRPAAHAMHFDDS